MAMNEALTNPGEAKLGDLVAMVRELGAGSMKLSGDDADGKKVFLVLIAVDSEAERLAPEVERLTADEDEKAPAYLDGDASVPCTCPEGFHTPGGCDGDE
jgi:hypothetical protein